VIVPGGNGTIAVNQTEATTRLDLQAGQASSRLALDEACVALGARFMFHRAMTSAIKKSLSALAAILSIGAGVLLSQSKQADGPRLYRVWSDAQGDTHLEEIDITTKGRPVIPGVVVNFPGAVTGPNGPRGGEQLHNTSVRQFAVTVFGQIDVQTSDGTRAHLRHELRGRRYRQRAPDF
jgi:hypothetical protein